MSELSKYIVSAVIVFGSIAGMLGLSALKKPPANKDSVELLPTVATFPAEAFNGKLGIELSGLVVPHREIDVAAEVGGRIKKKETVCRAGNYVTAGTLLLTIDKRDYELEIERLTAELQQSNNMIAELEREIEGLDKTVAHAQEDYGLQEAEYERRRAIGRSALSVSELEQAKRAMITSQRALTELQNQRGLLTTRKERLKSGIVLSQTQLSKANLDHDRTEIVAPFNGVIVADNVEEGDYVQRGQLVVTFEDTAKAEVKCNLRLSQLERVLKYHPQELGEVTGDPRLAYRLPPTPVTISAKLGDEVVIWDGTLVRFDGIGVDEQTKTIPCRVLVDEPIAKCASGPKALVRGMFVDVLIELDARENSTAETFLRIPAVAIQPGNYVWTVSPLRGQTSDGLAKAGSTGLLQRHEVRIVDRQVDINGEVSQNMAVITVPGEGIAHDDLVVVTPLPQPQPGIEVRFREIVPQAASDLTDEVPVQGPRSARESVDDVKQVSASGDSQS